MGKRKTLGFIWKNYQIHRKKKLRGRKNKSMKKVAKGLSGWLDTPSISWFGLDK